MDHGVRAAQFFETWAKSFDGMCDGFREHFGATCEWDQRPLIRTVGVEPALRFLEKSRRTLGLDTIRVDVLSLAAVGNVVHSARIDHLLRADGSLIGSVDVAGVLTFHDGRIVHWKEYFDPTVFAGRVVRSSIAHTVRRARRR